MRSDSCPRGSSRSSAASTAPRRPTGPRCSRSPSRTHPALSVEPIELDRPGPSYTVDTLRALRAAGARYGAGPAARRRCGGGPAGVARGRRRSPSWRGWSCSPGRDRRCRPCPRSPAASSWSRRSTFRPRRSAGGCGRGGRSGTGCPIPSRSTSLAPLIFGPRMIKNLMTAVFGSRFDRERKRIQPIVDQIHAHEERLKDLSEAELKAQTARVPASGSTSAPARSRPSWRRCGRPSTAAPIRSSGTGWSAASTSSRAAVQEGAGRGPGRASARGVRHGAGGLPPAARAPRSR